MSNQKDSGSFLDRWSARKQQSTRSETAAPAAAPRLDVELPDTAESAVAISDFPEPDVVQRPQEVESIESAETRLTDADMPALETLTSASDMSGFFSKGVSSALRKAALRHVFRQPSYNVRDGLDDYDGDYTSFEPLGDTVTADMKFHAARHERARLEAERLAEEQMPLASELPAGDEALQDNASTDDKQAIAEREKDEIASQQSPAEITSPEDQSDVAETVEEDAVNAATLSHKQMQNHDSATNKPTSKPMQSTASQPYETPDE